MKTTLCLALLLATTAAHALSDSEKETLMTAAVEAYEQQDYATALKKWQTLAEAGDAAAQNNLGILYDNGQGVAQDYGKARAWFEKAAAQKGNKEAQQIARQALQELDIADGQKPWHPDPAAQERERIREVIQRLVEGKGGTP